MISHPYMQKERVVMRPVPEEGKKNLGRVDLINSSGLVWEIKHAKGIPETRTKAAQKQAMEYEGMQCLATGLMVSGLGPAGAFQGSFTLSISNYYYQITYWTPAEGAVLYSVAEIDKPQTQAAYAYEFVEERKIVPVAMPVPQGVGLPIPLIPLGIPVGNRYKTVPVISSYYY